MKKDNCFPAHTLVEVVWVGPDISMELAFSYVRTRDNYVVATYIQDCTHESCMPIRRSALYRASWTCLDGLRGLL